MEKERLEWLPDHLKMLKMDNDFDSVEERECYYCFYDLHLSAVGCECFPDNYSCLRHFKLFCSCEMDKRFVLVRYTIDELSTLVEALEGEPRAIEAWETRNIGVVSASVEDACMHEQDMERVMCKTENYKEGKRSPSCTGTNERLNSNLPSSPHSHISSELVHSESHHETSRTPYVDLTGDMDNLNDTMLVMDNKVKEDKGSSLYLNIGDISDKPANSLLNIAEIRHNKCVPYAEKVTSAEIRKERDNIELSAGGISVLENEPSPCPTNVRNSGTLDGCKLFGVNLQMHSDLGQKLNSMLETGVLDTSNTSISLTNQSSPMKKFSISAELVSLGSVVYGKHWCSKHAIYPKGTLSVTSFPVLDCSFIFFYF